MFQTKQQESSRILLGLDKDGKKIYSTGEHQPPILLLAPHGSGKGVSAVIPNLLSFEDSVIVHDIKGENYLLTKNYRVSIGHEIFLWDPLAKKHRYNPLDFLNTDPDLMINDIQKLAILLISGDDAWASQARNLFLALVLYILAGKTRVKTIGEISRMINGDLFSELATGIDNTKTMIHSTGLLIIKSFLNKISKDQQTIIRVLHKYLELWTNPMIDYATSASDFDIADFTKRKMTLYVNVHPENISRLQPLLQFLYQHAFQRLMHQDNKHSVCFVLDDFISIGKLRTLSTTMPYFRGYKIRLFLIASSSFEIDHVYGSDAQALMSNCPYKICFMGCTTYAIRKDQQILVIEHTEPVISKKFIYYEDNQMKNKIT
jgi:type IV secretion system protein VirD4